MKVQRNPASKLVNEVRAREILQFLLQGFDPTTGEELPNGTVLQQVDVLRALLAGIEALEKMAARAQRRAQLPGNVGGEWSAEEEEKLKVAFNSGASIPDIASLHGRTPRAIQARLHKLGLLVLTSEQQSSPTFLPRSTGGGESQLL